MRYYLLAFLLIGADQLSKLLVRTHMYVGESICLLGDFFRLTYIQNRGAAFSMFSGQKVVLILIPLAVILFAIVVLHKKKRRTFQHVSGMEHDFGRRCGEFDRSDFSGICNGYVGF